MHTRLFHYEPKFTKHDHRVLKEIGLFINFRRNCKENGWKKLMTALLSSHNIVAQYRRLSANTDAIFEVEAAVVLKPHYTNTYVPYGFTTCASKGRMQTETQ